MGASIGISLYPDDGDDSEALVARADAAMYQAKSAGGHCYRFFSADVDGQIARQRRIRERLEQAIAAGGLGLAYQPQRSGTTQQISGAEALLRWRDEELGAVRTPELIAVAEGCELITRIDDWVLREVCRQVRAWRDSGLRVPPISVNVSPRRLRLAGYAADVENALTSAGLTPSSLCLEITETAVLDPMGSTHRNLEELRELGVSVVLDDFGTGFSSLTHVAQLPITGLKIDRAFVASLPDDDRAAAVVSCVSALARRLGLTIIAEGVESEQQLRFLVASGCTEFQGFLFSPAVDSATLAQMLGQVVREVA
jgi:EAL domain-containing protein (putative c-di-GMP-specific phosphodiesterase class I)